MFHILYLIENIVNGKIYVGKHSSSDINDGYMGSGKLLIAAIEKYGIESFGNMFLLSLKLPKKLFLLKKRLSISNS